MDTKKSLIILGSIAAAGAALYFILKPNSAKAATPTKKKTPTGGAVSTAPVRQTKDCVVSTFNCVSTTNETIQIPLSANCMDYQPAMPQCAPPREYGPSKVAPDYSFDDGYTYYGGYYTGYTPSGGLPYSGDRPLKGQYVSTQGYYSDRARLGFPPSGRGSYGGYGVQMVERDSPYAVNAFNRRPAYV